METEEIKHSETLAELEDAIRKFMESGGRLFGFFSPKEWNGDGSCVGIAGKEKDLVEMITNGYFQNPGVKSIIDHVIQALAEIQERSDVPRLMVPVNHDKKLMS